MDLIQKAVAWGTRKSPWVIHFNAGACNGCDIEVVDALTPRFDLERAGITKQGSPRHADKKNAPRTGRTSRHGVHCF